MPRQGGDQRATRDSAHSYGEQHEMGGLSRVMDWYVGPTIAVGKRPELCAGPEGEVASPLWTHGCSGG